MRYNSLVLAHVTQRADPKMGQRINFEGDVYFRLKLNGIRLLGNITDRYFVSYILSCPHNSGYLSLNVDRNLTTLDCNNTAMRQEVLLRYVCKLAWTYECLASSRH